MLYEKCLVVSYFMRNTKPHFVCETESSIQKWRPCVCKSSMIKNDWKDSFFLLLPLLRSSFRQCIHLCGYCFAQSYMIRFVYKPPSHTLHVTGVAQQENDKLERQWQACHSSHITKSKIGSYRKQQRCTTIEVNSKTFFSLHISSEGNEMEWNGREKIVKYDWLTKLHHFFLFVCYVNK